MDGVPIDPSEIGYTGLAFDEAGNIVKATDNFNVKYNLRNGTLTQNQNERYFIIKGNINDYNFNGTKDDIFSLKVKDTQTKETHSINCYLQNKNGINHEFKCYPPDDGITGSIYLAPLVDKYGNGISLEMDEGQDTISFPTKNSGGTTGNSTIINRGNYRKTSSGLSGGAIAGIVIACAVVLIIASIIAMMLRRNKALVENNSSIIGLRTIDHYSQ